MANPFVEKETSKIITAMASEFPKNHALAAAWIIANYKGINLKIIDMQQTSSLCDYNIVATAQNMTQANTMVNEIQYNLKRAGAEVISAEGLSDGDWILLDLGDIIVHIFQETTRDIYDLDTLWASHPQVTIPQEYYFSHPEMETKKEETTENYF